MTNAKNALKSLPWVDQCLDVDVTTQQVKFMVKNMAQLNLDELKKAMQDASDGRFTDVKILKKST